MPVCDIYISEAAMATSKRNVGVWTSGAVWSSLGIRADLAHSNIINTLRYNLLIILPVTDCSYQ